MNWKHKFILLTAVSVPAFSGYPVLWFDSTVVTGLTVGWLGYFFLVHIIILAFGGVRSYVNILAVAALVSVPVVFFGGVISYLIYLLRLGYEAGPSAYSPHYLSVCVTMLTVIPLALSLMNVVPFHRFEFALLQNKAGVSKLEKCLLMFLRVFNHIIYFVLPNILETMREEGHYRKRSTVRHVRTKIQALINEMIQLAVAIICSSIQYIPLWAVEISRLPDKKHKQKTV